MHVHNICISIRPTFKRLQKGFLALHYLLAFAQLMSTESMISFNYLILCHPTSPPALNLSSITVFSIVSALHKSGQGTEVSASASVLPMNIQDWFTLGLTGLISLQSKGLSRVFSNTTVPKHQFFNAQLSLWSNSHIHTWLLEKPQLWLDRPLSAKQCLWFLMLSGLPWKWTKIILSLLYLAPKYCISNSCWLWGLLHFF